MSFDISGLQPVESSNNTFNVQGLAPLDTSGLMQAPAPVPQGQEPFFDQDYFNSLQQLENDNLFAQSDDYIVKPNQSPEGPDNLDIGYGHKLTPQEIASKMIHGIPFPGQITNAQAKDILKTDMATQWQGAKKALGPEFDQLPMGAQILLTDYNFTGVLDKFPKFTNAIMAGDYDTAEAEYARYMTDEKGNKVPLGTRNTFAFKQLQKLRESSFNLAGLQQIDPSAGLPKMYPDKATPSSSDAGISSAKGSFIDYYNNVLEYADPTGVVETGLTLASGIPSFIGGWAKEIPTAIKGLLEGHPVEGAAKAREGAMEFAEEYTYAPRNKRGQRLSEAVMMPIEWIYEEADDVTRALGGEDTEVAAVHYLVDTLMIAGPPVFKGVKGARAKRAQKKELKKKVEEIIENPPEDLPPEVNLDTVQQSLDTVLGEIGNIPDKPLPVPKAKNEVNQGIVDRFMQEAQDRPFNSGNQQAYVKAAEVIAGWEDLAGVADHGQISKGKGKIRSLLEELIEKEKEPVVEGVKLEPVENLEPIEPVEIDVINTGLETLHGKDKTANILNDPIANVEIARIKKGYKDGILDLTEANEHIANIVDKYNRNEGLIKAKTTGEALDFVKKQQPEHAWIIDRIQNIVKDIPFQLFRTGKELTINELNTLKDRTRSINGRHVYNILDGKQWIGVKGEELRWRERENNFVLTTTVHESIHGATTKRYGMVTNGLKNFEGLKGRELRRVRKAANELDNLRKDIESKVDISQLENVAIVQSTPELIAFGLSHPTVMKQLRTIKYSKPQSLYNKFIASVRDLLSIPEKEANAFTKLLELTDQLMDNAKPQYEISGSGPFSRGQGMETIDKPVTVAQNMAETWHGIRQRQIQRQREKWTGSIREAIVDEVNPYEFLEQVERVEAIAGPTQAELTILEDMIKAEQREFETGIEGALSASEKAEMFLAWRKRYVEKINTATTVKEPPKTPIKSKDLAAVEPRDQIFKTLEEAEAYAKEHGIEREIVVDPMSGEAFFEKDLLGPEDMSWDRPDRWEVDSTDMLRGEDLEAGLGGEFELAETGTRDLFDILNDDTSGKVEGVKEWSSQKVNRTAKERVLADKLRKWEFEAERTGKSVEQLLDEMQVQPEIRDQLVKALEDLPNIEKRIREADPINEEIYHPQEGEVVYQGTTKHGKGENAVRVARPGLTDKLIAKFFGAEQLGKKGGVGRKALRKLGDAFEIRANTFERFSPLLKQVFFDSWVEKGAEYKREFRRLRREIKADAKALGRKSRERVSIVAHSMQKGGIEALEKMGIREIPELTSTETAMLQKYQRLLEDTWHRVNHMRSNVGLKPIGKIDNYFPFIHRLKEMERAGLAQDLAGLDMSKYSGQSKYFHGNFFPYEKSRLRGAKAIELDIFDLTENYMSNALKGIHVNPIAALAKELANYSLKIKGKKVQRLDRYNPELANLLRKWSDEILGIDPVYAALRQHVPIVAEGLSKLTKNITIATLFGTVSTAIKQPLALRGVLAETTPVDVAIGIRRALGDDFFKVNPERTSKQKFAAVELRQMDIFFDEMGRNLAEKDLGGIRDNIAQVAAYPMTFLDSMAADIGAYAGESFAKRKLGMGEAEAIQFANDLVNRTQGLGVRGAVSPIQANAITKWATLFQTFAINDFNYITRDILGIRNANPKNAKHMSKVLKYTAMGALANEMFGLVGLDAPTPEPIGAYQEVMAEGGSQPEAVAEALLELAEVVPVIGGAVKYDSSAFGAVGEFMNKLPQALGATLNLFVGSWASMSEKERFKEGMLIAETLGKAAGIPMTNQIKKSVRAAAKTDDPILIIAGAFVEEEQRLKSGRSVRTSKRPSANRPTR